MAAGRAPLFLSPGIVIHVFEHTGEIRMLTLFHFVLVCFCFAVVFGFFAALKRDRQTVRRGRRGGGAGGGEKKSDWERFID